FPQPEVPTRTANSRSATSKLIRSSAVMVSPRRVRNRTDSPSRVSRATVPSRAPANPASDGAASPRRRAPPPSDGRDARGRLPAAPNPPARAAAARRAPRQPLRHVGPWRAAQQPLQHRLQLGDRHPDLPHGVTVTDGHPPVPDLALGRVADRLHVDGDAVRG